ncbi:MAG: hypothetical protein P4L43_16210 [Syntrophobacteraceae bacterium]|nr:hypothetical protein [Syntrophobacteraceae bacterium]
MKKGIVLYVAKGKEDVPLKTGADLAEAARSFGVAGVSVANSEEDAAYGWMSLITRGMQQILFMAVEYDPTRDSFTSLAAPVRLYG